MNSIGLAIAVVCGVALGLLILGAYSGGLDPVYGWLLLGLALAAGLLAIVVRTSHRELWSSLLVACALVGLGRTLLIHPPVTSANLAFYNSSASGPAVEVQGVISAEPTYSDRAQTLRVSSIGIKMEHDPVSRPISGDMYAVVPRYPEYEIGETILLSGTLTVPPSFAGFDYAAYLAHLGVFSYMNFPKVTAKARDEGGIRAYIIAQRIAARQTLQSVVAEPEASIAVGVVTGDRTSIPAVLTEAFRKSGTTHILAISGENLSLIVGWVWLFYGGGPVKRRTPPLLAAGLIAFIVAYTLFTGATPSVVRAAIMAAVLLMGPIVGRRYDPTAALALSAAVMVLSDPELLSDAGFLLSFGSMLGIATFSPLLYVLLTRLRVPTIIAVPISVSAGATVATIPLSALLIGLVSLVGPIATLTSDLALAPLMLSGIGTVLLGIAGAQAAAIPSLLTWVSAGWLIGSAQMWASLPFAVIDTNGVTIFHVAIYYALVLSIFQLVPTPERRARLTLLPERFLIALLAAGAVSVWVVVIFLLVT